jgi:hypothetical protein
MNNVGVSESNLPKLMKMVLFIAGENYGSSMLKIFLQDSLVDLMPTAKVSSFVKEFVSAVEEQARSSKISSASSVLPLDPLLEVEREESGMINFSDTDSEAEITLGGGPQHQGGDFEDDDKYYQEEDDEYGRVAKRARGSGVAISEKKKEGVDDDDSSSTKKPTKSAWGGLGKQRESAAPAGGGMWDTSVGRSSSKLNPSAPPFTAAGAPSSSSVRMASSDNIFFLFLFILLNFDTYKNIFFPPPLSSLFG